MKCWAVIPAAGVGQRMAADLPKQYLPLAGRTVIDWTLGRLLEIPGLQGITVALGREDPYWRHTQYAAHPSVTRVDGGEQRCNSVLNGLNALSDRVSPDCWVLVHDAARPCVNTQDINRLISTVDEQQQVGGLLGMPVRDTMKRTDDQNLVTETVERNGLWHAFTPQMFRLGELRTALGQALAAGIEITDEASAMQWAGHQPLMVEGRGDNIKITRPADLELAEFYLRSTAPGN